MSIVHIIFQLDFLKANCRNKISLLQSIKKDHGFLLKQFGEKGWGLYNLQTLAVQMSSSPGVKTNTPEKGENKDVSKFTEVLSKVADDPSIMEKPAQKAVVEKKPEVVAVKEEKKVEPVVVQEKTEPKPVKTDVTVVKTITENVEEKPVVAIEKPEPVKTDPVIAKKEIVEIKPVEVVEKIIIVDDKDAKQEDVVIVESKNSGPNNEPYTPSKVKRWSESSTTEGFGLVFIDDYSNGTQDTIRVLIPNPKQIEVPVSNNKGADKIDSIITGKKRDPKSDKSNTEKEVIEFTPKANLRHPGTYSRVEDFTQGVFKEVIDDENAEASKIKKSIIL